MAVLSAGAIAGIGAASGTDTVDGRNPTPNGICKIH